MILAVCSDKGAPGVTTLATALGMVWPGESGVLEADPSGGDLTFRLRPALNPEQEFLHPEPSVFTLAADARTGLAGTGLARYGQQVTVGLRVIPGPVQAEMYSTVHPLWPLVAKQTALWSETVIADLGRLQPGHPAWPMAQAATAVLVLARPDVEGLYHLRERVRQLGQALGNDRLSRNPVAVVMVAGSKEQRSALQQVEHMLHAAGSPIPVAGWMADDPGAVAALRAGEMSRSLRNSSLLRSVRELAGTVTQLWPQFLPTPEGAQPAQLPQPVPPAPAQLAAGPQSQPQYSQPQHSGQQRPQLQNPQNPQDLDDDRTPPAGLARRAGSNEVRR